MTPSCCSTRCSSCAPTRARQTARSGCHTSSRRLSALSNEARGGWEEPQTARWGRPNKVSAIHAVLRHAIDAALCDTAARDEIAAAMRAWHGAGEHFALIR